MAKNLVKIFKNDGIDIDLEKISDKIKSNKGKNKNPLQELTAEKMKVRAKKMDKERILTAEEEEKVTGGTTISGTAISNSAAKKADVTEDAVIAAAEVATMSYGTAASNAGTATVSNGTLSNETSYNGSVYGAKDAAYKSVADLTIK